ncbi:hypothetical protein Lgee_0661 [Legionella geestiana]|uniref:Uncharacterized protein n=1 Tax=Legionella geestiana TaxID=45065 RepID=A0A0W0U3Q0_9GAMM|nr:hypothetical protein [Legionella geestiana]KTD02332.1 hypothetical protein Lgee_0661 [Legionella geestiana]QBS12192.1 hypothetical protein E4T54_05220 [Legionella geestiana]QDQ40094.1 hypothetical protein E3226_006620 [Legionella geestiana]STX53078.1 Uncharacterised protein [Legionella geestiana]
MAASPEKTAFALLDVDHTVVFNKDDEINHDLLSSLKAAGITDVYFFTDMLFTQDRMQDRRRLIAMLESEHFTVHGVMAPMDLLWDKIDLESADAFMKDLRREWTNVFHGEAFEAFFSNFLASYKAIEALFDTLEYSASPGQAFANACTEDANKVFNKSMLMKLIATRHTNIRQLPHVKALMFELFLQNHLQHTSKIVVADDLKDAIYAITPYKNKLPVPLTVIHVNDRHMGKEFYQLSLEGKSACEILKIQCLQLIRSWLETHPSPIGSRLFTRSTTRLMAKNLFKALQKQEPEMSKAFIEEFLQQHQKLGTSDLGALLREKLARTVLLTSPQPSPKEHVIN